MSGIELIEPFQYDDGDIGTPVFATIDATLDGVDITLFVADAMDCMHTSTVCSRSECIDSWRIDYVIPMDVTRQALRDVPDRATSAAQWNKL